GTSSTGEFDRIMKYGSGDTPLPADALASTGLTTSRECTRGGSTLVVENEAAISDVLAANLQRAGYRVMTAGDVPQAEALVRESRPDLVLLDWVLPGIPGLTFARRLRGDQRPKDISIVLLSARAEGQGQV